MSGVLDAMAKVEPQRRRGIVRLDANAVVDARLAAWDAAGIRGIRINVSPVRRPEAGLADALKSRIARYAVVARELGWHLDFLTPGWLPEEVLPTLRALPVPLTLGHRGRLPA